MLPSIRSASESKEMQKNMLSTSALIAALHLRNKKRKCQVASIVLFDVCLVFTSIVLTECRSFNKIY